MGSSSIIHPSVVAVLHQPAREHVVLGAIFLGLALHSRALGARILSRTNAAPYYKHLDGIEPEPARQRQAKSRIRRGLPKRIAQVRKAGDELLKETKGLARK